MMIYDLNGLRINKISKKNGVGISGVYLWGVKFGNCYIPIYVGKGRNIYERIFQHLASWRGGEYMVPSWQVIIGNQTIIGTIQNKKNLIYFPEGANLYYQFLNDPKIQQVIDKVIDGFFCILEPLPNVNLSIEEDALATLVGKYKLISKHKKNNTPPTLIAQKIINNLNNLNQNCI